MPVLNRFRSKDERFQGTGRTEGAGRRLLERAGRDETSSGLDGFYQRGMRVRIGGIRSSIEKCRWPIVGDITGDPAHVPTAMHITADPQVDVVEVRSPDFSLSGRKTVADLELIQRVGELFDA